ncbi:MAG: hypothetical protein WCX83_02150 [Candidatus Cloacimonas sp.]|nr:hypothetical protein [Candidatus Cloacimonadota bacterium]
MREELNNQLEKLKEQLDTLEPAVEYMGKINAVIETFSDIKSKFDVMLDNTSQIVVNQNKELLEGTTTSVKDMLDELRQTQKEIESLHEEIKKYTETNQDLNKILKEANLPEKLEHLEREAKKEGQDIRDSVNKLKTETGNKLTTVKTELEKKLKTSFLVNIILLSTSLSFSITLLILLLVK